MTIRRKFRVVVTVMMMGGVGVAAVGACDPLPDECQLDDEVCDGNIANHCRRPGPESRLKSSTEDCGTARTCVMIVDSYGYTESACMRNVEPECEEEGVAECHGALAAQCLTAADGRLVWVEHTCREGDVCRDGWCH